MSLFGDSLYSRVLRASPDSVSKLIASGWLKAEVHEEGPALAWTSYDEDARCWKVNFHSAIQHLSSEDSLKALWRHEVGHIALAHFSKVSCNPEDPIRSRIEQLQVGDVQVNTYLLGDMDSMRDIGNVSLTYLATPEQKEQELAEGNEGFLNPEKILPEIGLKVQEYPWDVIHSYMHQKMDDEAEANGQDKNWTKQIMGMCGGIDGPGVDVGMAEAAAAVVAGVTSDDPEMAGGTQWGEGSSMGKIKLTDSNLPKWIGPLETFARSIVEVILSEKRSHTRPQPIYKAHGIHMPTSRPRWDYSPSTVVLCVDTSGSMLSELRYVAPVITYLAQHKIKTRLIAGDVRVTFDDLVDKIPGGLVGGGGTDIVPIIDRAYEYEPESVIIFTDGYVPSWGRERKGIPVLWVGTREVPPYGTAVGANGEKVR